MMPLIPIKRDTESLLNLKQTIKAFELIYALLEFMLKNPFHTLWVVCFDSKWRNDLLNILVSPSVGHHYLGSFWDPIVEKVEERLSCLEKISNLLGVIPVYYMSLFNIPVKVANKIEQLQRSFLWEGGGSKKDNLIKWEVVYKPKNAGVLVLGTLFGRTKHSLGNCCGDLHMKEEVCDNPSFQPDMDCT